MRIISGRAGGIRLASVPGRNIRPTEDRVKESIFSTVGNLSGKLVVDLFAGTGALGLEALSRGARLVHAFEVERTHCRVIQENVRAVERSLGETGGYVLHCASAATAGRMLELAGSVEVVFADPPYETAAGAYGWRELLQDATVGRLMAPGGLLVLEHGADKTPPWQPASGWRHLRTKSFGIRAVSYGVWDGLEA